MRKAMLIVCLIFGGIMVSSFAQAQEIEGVYCKFDVKEWKGSIIDFIRNGTDCSVQVDYVSPYLLEPVRSVEQALEDMNR